MSTRRAGRTAAVAAALLAGALALSGCTYTLFAEKEIAFDVGGTRVASALGRGPRMGGSTDDVYYAVRVEPDTAPEFLLLFPDGLQISSRGIDAQVLRERTPGYKWEVKPGHFAYFRYDHPAHRGAYTVFYFGLRPDGSVSSMQITNCKYPDRPLISRPDGSHAVALPATRASLEEIFGPAQMIRNELTLVSLEC